MNQTNSQFENTVKTTVKDLQQILETLRTATCLREALEKKSVHERAFIYHLPQVCKEIIDYYEYSQKYETYEYFRNQKNIQENK